MEHKKASDITDLKREREEGACEGEMYFSLNLNAFRQTLINAQDKFSNTPGVQITLPNLNGELETFLVWENSNFDPELQLRFPQIRAYVGKGIEDKHATVNLSISPKGIQTMVFRADNGTEFLEAYDKQATAYVLFNSKNRINGKLPFNCSTDDVALADDVSDKFENTTLADNARYKTFRLAISCTAEYANFFGASSSAEVALVLAAMNNTMTRVNGVMERDLAVHLNIIPENDQVIFYDSSSDPYSSTVIIGGEEFAPDTWNDELASTLQSTLGNAAFDIGHLFGASGGGGNAGCIGCVCSNDVDEYKGSAYTSPSNGVPAGDTFDIDFVVHEMGHQLGASHTFTYNFEGSGVQTEPGSGTTIMAYAGVAFSNSGTSFNVQNNSDALFSYKSINQIQVNLNTSSTNCAVTTPLGGINATPTVASGGNFTIPISTPFVLTGSGSDADATDSLTYIWEQNDVGTAATTQANSRVFGTKTAGPIFRTFTPTAAPIRYFPQLLKTLSGTIVIPSSTNANWESCSSIAKTTRFVITARDNHPGMGQTKTASSTVNVVATAGPFAVTSQTTTGISYTGGSTQTITWNVLGTDLLAGASTVDILLATNVNGNNTTFSTVLATGVPNNGSATVVIPNLPTTSTTCRFMVKASANIFFALNSRNFTIQANLGTEDFGFNDFTLYPNPNKGSFNIQFDSTTGNDIQVDVFDMRGRKIFGNQYSNQATFNENIQLNGTQSGVYLVSVSDGNKKVVKRLIIE
ncbi:MAG: M12 family metallo-peptidase [Flavobacterium sp. JAD_PAG50586_2]|nr:MAG: M12 family metallo-peptidase [Flavobacterium sp. JAD_PAG50586_2]